MIKPFLYYPTKPAIVNQKFGENSVWYKQFGLVGHDGEDFAVPHGTPVYCPFDGVAYYNIDENKGEGFAIRSTKQYNYVGGQTAWFLVKLWHLCSKDDPVLHPLIPCDGKPVNVTAGQLIAYSDNTGYPKESTGDHLHFGLYPQWKTYGAFYNWENNSYGGAINPNPYFNGLYAQDISTQEETPITPAEAENLSEQLTLVGKILQLIKKWLNY